MINEYKALENREILEKNQNTKFRTIFSIKSLRYVSVVSKSH